MASTLSKDVRRVGHAARQLALWAFWCLRWVEKGEKGKRSCLIAGVLVWELGAKSGNDGKRWYLKPCGLICHLFVIIPCLDRAAWFVGSGIWF